MDTSKTIIGKVGSGRYTVTAPIIKEDYGLYLKIEGLELPSTYEVDFSNSEHNGTSVTMIGNSDGVLIPNKFVSSGKDVFAFLYHVGVDYGRTVYTFRIPNKLRPDRTDEQPIPEQESAIDQAISALNSAVEQTAQDVIDADARAQSASEDANRAEQARDDAQTYANNANASATASARDARDARDALEEFTTPTASATTLQEGSNATASYADGHFDFGIPKGDKGEDALCIEITTPTGIIPVGANGFTTGIVKLTPEISARKGNAAVPFNVTYAGKILATNRAGTVYSIGAVIASGKAPVWTITDGFSFPSNQRTLSITLTADGQTFTLTYPFVVIKDGAQGAQGERGEKGEKGDTGVQGIQGIQGVKGDKGDKGAQGERGEKGEKGDTGPQGDDYVLTEQDKQDIAGLVDVPVMDVQINGQSIVTNGIANAPIATNAVLGVVKAIPQGGLQIASNGNIGTAPASSVAVKAGTNKWSPLVPITQHESVFYGLAKAASDTTQSQSSNAVGNYTESAKSAISEMLNGSVSVSGTTPTIVAKSGIRYVCGEVSTLDLTLPQSGIVDVVFESGATATVLTITGTVKWANGFDPTSLDANTTYEINIMDGLGVAVGWT